MKKEKEAQWPRPAPSGRDIERCVGTKEDKNRRDVINAYR